MKYLEFAITVLAILTAMAISKRIADALASKGVNITAGTTAAIRS